MQINMVKDKNRKTKSLMNNYSKLNLQAIRQNWVLNMISRMKSHLETNFSLETWFACSLISSPTSFITIKKEWENSGEQKRYFYRENSEVV